ncbi:hypothetical protein ACHELS_004202 [Vibrio vulnificus]|uniref:hypothetical protein n=2 Tax=Vibrio vulnificus TaxID=672 RepID=UPI0018DF4966|nr:hypothetical protein [Vibrio vulnificus]MCG6291327.1 hypothetical protein [Vibrio vulnificus]
MLLLGRVASLGGEVELLVSGWSPLAVKLVLALWFASENQTEIVVLSQVNHVFVVKHNKQFNSDSQRLALSLRVEFSVYGAVFKSSVCAAHTLIGRYVFFQHQRIYWCWSLERQRQF